MSNVYDCIIIRRRSFRPFCRFDAYKAYIRQGKILHHRRKRQVRKKLALTGSGRCNLSNKNASADKYHTDCPELLEDAFKAFGPEDAVSFFENDLGIVTVCDNGLYYPSTYRAQTVIDSFRFYLRGSSGVNMKFGSKCDKDPLKTTASTRLSLKDGSVYSTQILYLRSRRISISFDRFRRYSWSTFKGLIDPKDDIVSLSGPRLLH